MRALAQIEFPGWTVTAGDHFRTDDAGAARLLRLGLAELVQGHPAPEDDDDPDRDLREIIARRRERS
jgi:hypothetical protein